MTNNLKTLILFSSIGRPSSPDHLDHLLASLYPPLNPLPFHARPYS